MDGQVCASDGVGNLDPLAANIEYPAAQGLGETGETNCAAPAPMPVLDDLEVRDLGPFPIDGI